MDKKILKFKDFIIEKIDDIGTKDEEDIKKLDDDINKERLKLKKKNLEILKQKKKEQTDKGEYTDL